ncbi:hypothetical protein CKAN_02216000 [Cinnamomum micranthum f. kanehirae]|uniref:Uncharacterized protein n=1 Tax=Cinnamomum micranthum f. kanehirae TaxID=337451 RepID=A0A3S4PNT3_9MAGN|nr:hypothetical protein CKAN_02216000 [Cinnamomum micranthum f. kanehirae]
MGCLIKTDKDVDILCRKGIIDNGLGSEKLVASHFKSVSERERENRCCEDPPPGFMATTTKWGPPWDPTDHGTQRSKDPRKKKDVWCYRKRDGEAPIKGFAPLQLSDGLKVSQTNAFSLSSSSSTNYS